MGVTFETYSMHDRNKKNIYNHDTPENKLALGPS
jgi:hypothetical protein